MYYADFITVIKCKVTSFKWMNCMVCQASQKVVKNGVREVNCKTAIK